MRGSLRSAAGENRVESEELSELRSSEQAKGESFEHLSSVREKVDDVRFSFLTFEATSVMKSLLVGDPTARVFTELRRQLPSFPESSPEQEKVLAEQLRPAEQEQPRRKLPRLLSLLDKRLSDHAQLAEQWPTRELKEELRALSSYLDMLQEECLRAIDRY